MISIFTPTHNGIYLADAYESLKEQTYKDWEWVIVQNNGAKVPDFKDKRVKVFNFDYGGGKVGACKRYACGKCSGEVFCELDHDDLLTPTCLEEVQKAFNETKADMVYSNFAMINMDWSNRTWNSYFGWEFKPYPYKDHILMESLSPEVHPSNLGRIWFTPNHVRAWRKDFYWKIGGHNQNMKISDDHDLMCRTYIYGKIHHIKKCLYIYRVHGDNTWLQNMTEIQNTMWDVYCKYIWDMIGKWADEQGLLKIDLGGAINKWKDYKTVDLHDADIVSDLNKKWPFQDNSVGVFRANDIIEHLDDPIHTMNEAYRCLAHSGFLMINVPSALGEGAFSDPTHKSFWVKRSFRYYTDPNMRRFIPTCNAKFQVVKLTEGTLGDKVPYIFAHLTAVKNGLKLHGENLWELERNA
jgi:glycosyltransferase involved in cell wall biosynthesis